MPIERVAQSLELESELTKRRVNPGAEKWMGIITPVLDHGFVYLADYMGDDKAIEEAARGSYGKGTRSVNETEGLIRYLRRHHHSTPFEMGELKFHAKLPIFVARQWIRHRTANVNEYSARYSILSKEFHIPDTSEVADQSSTNRQGRGEQTNEDYANEFRDALFQYSLSAYNKYEYFLNDDGKQKPKDPNRPMIARETAREILPINYYTEWTWKIDLHNLFHFLRLRSDPHAQFEVRQYSDAMAKIVADAYPLSWKAFMDYEVDNIDLTKLEKETMFGLLEQNGISFTEIQISEFATKIGMKNKREISEMKDKFKSLGLLK